jgi:hypothetical protein
MILVVWEFGVYVGDFGEQALFGARFQRGERVAVCVNDDFGVALTCGGTDFLFEAIAKRHVSPVARNRCCEVAHSTLLCVGRCIYAAVPLALLMRSRSRCSTSSSSQYLILLMTIGTGKMPVSVQRSMVLAQTP